MRTYKGYESVSVNKIPISKLKKAIKTGKLSLTAGDLKGDLRLLLHPLNAKLVKAAQAKNKGINSLMMSIPEIISDLDWHDKSGGSMNGGSLWSFLKSAGKEIGDFYKENKQIIQPILSAVADKAIPAAFSAIGQPGFSPLGRQAFKKLTGVGLKEKRIQNLAKARAAKANKTNKSNKRINIMASSNLGGSFRIQ